MNLKTKILLTTLTVSFILFGSIIGYISYTMKDLALSNAERYMEATVKAYANAMSSKFDYQIGISETFL